MKKCKVISMFLVLLLMFAMLPAYVIGATEQPPPSVSEEELPAESGASSVEQPPAEAENTVPSSSAQPEEPQEEEQSASAPPNSRPGSVPPGTTQPREDEVAGPPVALQDSGEFGTGYTETDWSQFQQVTVPTPRTRSALPATVNLLESGYFPPLASQGQINSCVAFSSTYYAFTYEVARLNADDPNWDVTKPEYQFSPKQVYNSYNGGTNTGSGFDSPLQRMSIFGALRQSEFPYAMGGTATMRNIAELCWNKEYLRRALEYRVGNTYTVSTGINSEDTPISSPSSPALISIKTVLDAGHPLLFATSSPALFDDGVAYYNSRPVLRVNQGGAHAMTIVGYDDNYEFDINGNGTIEAFEKGALMVANSWGRNYKNNGWTYVMYDALNPVSNCDALNGDVYTLPWSDQQFSGARGELIGGGNFVYFDVEKHDVDLTAELTLANTARSDLSASGSVDIPGVGNTPIRFVTGLYLHNISANYGLDYPFDIYSPASSEVTFVLPYDSARQQVADAGGAGNCTWYLAVNNGHAYGAPTPVQVKNIALVQNSAKNPQAVFSGGHDAAINNNKRANFKIGGPEPVPLEAIKLNRNEVSLQPTQTLALEVEYLPGNTTDDRSVQWSSSNEAVATVDNSGTVSAVSPGETTITATAASKTASCAVSVVDTIEIESVRLIPSDLIVLSKGESTIVQLEVTPPEALFGKTVNWQKISVASPYIELEDLGNGEAQVTCITDITVGLSGCISASVDGKQFHFKASLNTKRAISISSKSELMSVGENKLLTASCAAYNNLPFTWASSDPTVVSVGDDGRITALAPGDAYITVSVREVSATCFVRVSPKNLDQPVEVAEYEGQNWLIWYTEYVLDKTIDQITYRDLASITNIYQASNNSNYLNYIGFPKDGVSVATKIPAIIEHYFNLQSFTISLDTFRREERPIPLFETIHENVGKLPYLTKLTFGGTDTTELPESIGNLHNLEELSLNRMLLTRLPDSVSNLHKLKKLTIRSMDITQLPEDFSVFPNLTYLWVTGTGIESVSPSVFDLSKLTYLNLSDNKLTFIPDNIGQLTLLDTLNIYGNNLETIPESIGLLTSLRTLDLSENNLQYLPESIGQLSQLVTLKLQNNALRELPQSCDNLESLLVLYINQNCLTSLPVNILKNIKSKFYESQTAELEVEIEAGQPITVPLPIVAHIRLLIGAKSTLTYGINGPGTLPLGDANVDYETGDITFNVNRTEDFTIHFKSVYKKSFYRCDYVIHVKFVDPA